MDKKIHLLLSMAALMVSFHLVAQTHEETRSLKRFDAVKISNSIEAELIKGDKHAIQISASGIELDRITTEIDKQTLEVEISGTNFGASSVKVIITYVDISDITANTAAKVFVKDPIAAKTVKLTASTASYIEAAVNTQDLILEASTNAKIFIDGTAQSLDLKAYTNAEINGEKLETEDAQVKVNTAGHANFHVNESIKGSAATGGKVLYTGDPNMVDVRTNTGGSIERDN